MIFPFFTGCTDENNDQPDISNAPNEGQFSFSYKAGFITLTDTLEINLDTLDKSEVFQFRIKNIGKEDLSNISILSSNSNCVLSNTYIRNLKGVKNLDFLEQKISLNINHGVMYPKSTKAFFMPSGDNNVLLIFSGKTVNGINSDSIIANMFVKLKVFVRYADFNILLQDSLIAPDTIDLFLPKDTIKRGPDGVSSVNGFRYKNADFYTFENIGNSPLIYTVFSVGLEYKQLDAATVQPNEKVNILWPADSVYLKVNSNGVMQNINKKLSFFQGNSYLLLKKEK